MKRRSSLERERGRALALVAALALLWGCEQQEPESQTMTSAANPCAVNPCAAAMNPCNPCASGQVSASQVKRPAGTELYRAPRAELVSAGEALWKDTSLSTNGMSCSSCHMNNRSFLATFTEPYPHTVAMAKAQAGVDEVNIDEMVQLCMIVPMQAQPLPWESKELAALSAYATDVAQKAFVTAVAANPCMLRGASNPCNPCAANPCAGMNPCAANPCASNPCMGNTNPCNPCMGK